MSTFGWISNNQKKRDLVAAARAAGWRGKSYKKAKRFDQALTRETRRRRLEGSR